MTWPLLSTSSSSAVSPPNGGPTFMEVYAPRTALYEVLPDFLLRLGDPGPAQERSSTCHRPPFS